MEDRAVQRKGFTMIELVIVAALIAILATIAIPNLMRSRIQSNESAAVGNLHTVLSAESAHNAAKGQYGNYATLTSSGTPPYLDGIWPGVKGGYSFAEITLAGSNNEFYAAATPVGQGKTGNRGFMVTHEGVIRWNSDGVASASGTPLDVQ